jgi:hypothetical protein
LSFLFLATICCQVQQRLGDRSDRALELVENVGLVTLFSVKMDGECQAARGDEFSARQECAVNRMTSCDWRPVSKRSLLGTCYLMAPLTAK